MESSALHVEGYVAESQSTGSETSPLSIHLEPWLEEMVATGRFVNMLQRHESAFQTILVFSVDLMELMQYNSDFGKEVISDFDNFETACVKSLRSLIPALNDSEEPIRVRPLSLPLTGPKDFPDESLKASGKLVRLSGLVSAMESKKQATSSKVCCCSSKWCQGASVYVDFFVSNVNHLSPFSADMAVVPLC